MRYIQIFYRDILSAYILSFYEKMGDCRADLFQDVIGFCGLMAFVTGWFCGWSFGNGLSSGDLLLYGSLLFLSLIYYI
jgi:hypothetical protein